MIKIILLLILSSSQLFGQEFTGCGEYIFKGTLKYNEKAPFKIVYLVHEGSRSQMVFKLTEKEDLMKLALMVDLPSTFKASITKPMNGTNGFLSFPSEIARRFPDPLKNSDTGITKIKNIKCD
jgi:hypothetical protein